MEKQKRALAVHDISCVGRCSLTVALPILSAAGVECSCLPTAVLSTHTGGFQGYTYRDLTADVMPIAEHWKSLGLRFDAIYTGYLGSPEQADLMGRVMALLGDAGTLRLVDPVMGDQGALYTGIRGDFPEKMKRLCAGADVIIPNLTEASLLLGLPYREGELTPAYVEQILRGLAGLGAKNAVLTGVSFDQKSMGAAAWDGRTVSYAFSERVPGVYCGTGDIWGSAFLAAQLRGEALQRACQIACDFTTASILQTREDGTDVRYGARFEAALPGLMRALGIL